MDQNLKHRLTGAIILVSVAVIFIPVILEGPDNEWAPLSHSIPDAPQMEYKAHLDVPAPIPAPVEPPVAEKPVEPVKTVVPVPEPKPEAEPVKQTQPATKSLSGWYVQVGSFSQEMNASGLSKRLELSGYENRLQKATTKTGYAWRVMVGPDKNRAAAEKLRDRLAKDRQLKGIVIHNPG